MFLSNKRWGGLRKSSTSARLANWGILVSSLVETITVLDSSGSTCKTPPKKRKKPQEFSQCRLSWQKEVPDFRTCEVEWQKGWKLHLHHNAPSGCIAPVTAIFQAEDNELLMLHLGAHQRLYCPPLQLFTHNRTSSPKKTDNDNCGCQWRTARTTTLHRTVKCLCKFQHRTWRAWLFCPGAAAMRPGVSMMVRFGQYLYSIFRMISLAQNWHASCSRRIFSAWM